MYLKLTPLHFALGSLNVTLIIYSAWNSLRVSIMLFEYVAVLSLAAQLHMRDIKRSLQHIIHASSQLNANSNHSKHYHLARRIYFAHAQYCDLRSKAAHINANILSPYWLMALIPNLSFNILIVTLFVYWPLNQGQTILFLAILSFQNTFPFSFALALIKWSKSLTTCRRELFRAQPYLNSAHAWHCKVKLMAHIEQIHNRKSFRFTIGFLSCFSSKAIVNVSFFL